MLFKVFSCIFLLIPLTVTAFNSPWGKDADLLLKTEQKKEAYLIAKSSIGTHLSYLVIKFHQEVISPADGPRSHFIPSSSQYTLEAIRKYGFFQGWILGCDRLLRENEALWIYPEIISPEGKLMKYNPVP